MIIGTKISRQIKGTSRGSLYKKKNNASDKLILFNVVAFSSLSMTALGIALANCARRDILLSLSRLNAEVANYAKGGLDLMIKQGWLERTPEAPNRKHLRSHHE